MAEVFDLRSVILANIALDPNSCYFLVTCFALECVVNLLKVHIWIGFSLDFVVKGEKPRMRLVFEEKNGVGD